MNAQNTRIITNAAIEVRLEGLFELIVNRAKKGKNFINTRLLKPEEVTLLRDKGFQVSPHWRTVFW